MEETTQTYSRHAAFLAKMQQAARNKDENKETETPQWKKIAQAKKRMYTNAHKESTKLNGEQK